MPYQIKVTCDSIAANATNSNVRFLVKDETKKLSPGALPNKTVIIMNYSDPDEAKQFNPGTEYTLTIE